MVRERKKEKKKKREKQEPKQSGIKQEDAPEIVSYSSRPLCLYDRYIARGPRGLFPCRHTHTRVYVLVDINGVFFFPFSWFPFPVLQDQGAGSVVVVAVEGEGAEPTRVNKRSVQAPPGWRSQMRRFVSCL